MNSKQSSKTPSRTSRAYDASGRQAEATARRARVVDAARELFVEHGYGETSIAAIAKQAGVSAQTVYAQFESKAGILAQVVYTAVAGDHDDAGLARERPAAAAAFAPGLGPGERIDAMTRYARESNERSAHLIELAESVAGTDDAVADLVREFRDGQRGDAVAAVAAFAPGELRDDLTAEDIADLMWTVAGPRTYRMLVGHAGRSPEEWERWVRTTMRAALLRA